MTGMIARILKRILSQSPASIRSTWCSLGVESMQQNDTGMELRELFALRDYVDCRIDETAIRAHGGIHPKHDLVNYHEFFLLHLKPGMRVLDVGCGMGTVAWHLAQNGMKVTGVEIDTTKVELAVRRYKHENLKFVNADATVASLGPTDAVILSNVLEHLEKRSEFLRKLADSSKASLFLIRVPSSMRHWQVPMRESLGISSYNDPTHKIEYTVEQLNAELQQGGLSITTHELCWGEIWAKAEPWQK